VGELYKYAWDERHVAGHLDQLVALRDNSGGAGDALAAVLEAYALILHEISHRHHGADLSALVHQGPDVARAQHQLSHFIQGIVADAAKVGDVRYDISPAELTNYALHVALGDEAISLADHEDTRDVSSWCPREWK
jgi:hypothetical protein